MKYGIIIIIGMIIAVLTINSFRGIEVRIETNKAQATQLQAID